MSVNATFEAEEESAAAQPPQPAPSSNLADEFLNAKSEHSDTPEENSEENDLDAQLTKIKSDIMKSSAGSAPKDPIAIEH